jgi:phosphate transport system permease protein
VTTTVQEPATPAPKAVSRRRTGRRVTTLSAYGEPMLWLTGGALAIALVMIAGLVGLVVVQGASTFWPTALVHVTTAGGQSLMGEVAVTETYRPSDAAFERLPAGERDAARAAVAERGGEERRRMLRTGNFELTGTHFTWVSDFELREETRPEWALTIERRSWGRFYGFPHELRVGEETVASTPEAVWQRFLELHPICRERHERVRKLETHDVGGVNAELEALRLERRALARELAAGSPALAAAEERIAARERELEGRFRVIEREIAALNEENARYRLVLSTADGQSAELKVADVVRAYPANQLDLAGRLGTYLGRWGEYLADEPREANSEGGVYPAIFGTVVMTLLMSVLVVPFGVLAALYLREYAKQGFLVSAVRIAVNNLAGVPSIVFGVFGLGFFCYIVGAGLDQLLYAERLPNPTYGKGGLIWASFTLALLTLPVVIVATEEAFSAVPGSMREGSYACGATKWQTIQRIVLPRALPGIMTGMILAIARGAGEVAPLMLVGAVKLAPELPVETSADFPFVHLFPERSFMHLGFHIYDLGFQSQNSEAAKPMVYTTTLLLIAIIVVLNVAAIGVRARLRRKFLTSHA